MPELLKNRYNKIFFERFTHSVKEVVLDFDIELFLNDIYDGAWEGKELKERMRHITLVLKKHLPDDFESNVRTILKLIPVFIKNGFKPDNLEFMFLPDFIEVYGQEHFSISVNSFESITQFVSCEFAIRPFIISNQEEMLQQMFKWSSHKSHFVRRLSSEGCRPRLPWAMAIPSLKKDPKPILPILENLKNDTSEYVRRSVANNLNDISKDNPEAVIEIVKNWKGENPETDKLVKHASRTLLKQGNSELMTFFGFGTINNIKINDFKVLNPKVKIGEALSFQFKLNNKSKSASKIRLEYGIYYLRANGTLSKKVFKISEKMYAGNTVTTIGKEQSFKRITTRKFYTGSHEVSVIINGKEMEKKAFELVE